MPAGRPTDLCRDPTDTPLLNTAVAGDALCSSALTELFSTWSHVTEFRLFAQVPTGGGRRNRLNFMSRPKVAFRLRSLSHNASAWLFNVDSAIAAHDQFSAQSTTYRSFENQPHWASHICRSKKGRTEWKLTERGDDSIG